MGTFPKPKVGDLYRWAGSNEHFRLLIDLKDNSELTFKIIILEKQLRISTIDFDGLCLHILDKKVIHYAI